MAKPVTCTEARTNRIADLVTLGVTPLVAAATEGVTERQFAEWMSRGERNGQGEWRFAQFRRAVLEAEATAEALLVLRVQAAAIDGEWRAAAWLAERRFGDRWVRRSVFKDDDDDRGRDDPATTPGPDPFAELDNVRPIRR